MGGPLPLSFLCLVLLGALLKLWAYSSSSASATWGCALLQKLPGCTIMWCLQLVTCRLDH
jgi:hypothetical protein